jgi:hypothetical protein
VKIKLLFLLLTAFSLVACASSPEVDYPDDQDIATIVAQTLTQQAVEGMEGTPAPEGGESTQPGAGDQAQPPAGEPGGERADPGPESPPEGGTGEAETSNQGAADDPTSTSGEDTSQETSETPSQPAGEVADPGIPGLPLWMLWERLTGYGFNCFEPQVQEGEYLSECSYETTDYQFNVMIWGRLPDTVDLVEAAAFYYGELDYADLTSAVFELLAEIPYGGAVPEAAGEWVGENMPGINVVGDEAASVFGGVRFYLYAFPSSHVLEIGNGAPQE